MVRKWLAAFSCFLLQIPTADAGPRYAFRVKFTDKGDIHATTSSHRLLSARALERRARMGISTDALDFPVSTAYLDEILSVTEGTLHVTSRWLNSCVIWLDDSSKIAKLAGRQYVADIEYVGFTNSTAESPSREPSSSNVRQKTTGNPAYYGSTWAQTDFVDGDCLHDKGWRGQGKLIAVLDDGFHYVNTAPAFDSIFSSGSIVDTRNFVAGGTDVYTDFNTHGTMVLSTMAGNIPNTYVGAAPNAQYALYVTEKPPSETPVEMDNMVAALERADSIGADIISASIGYNTFDPPFPSLTFADLDGKTTVAAIGVNIAAQKGMLVVITAGNEGSGGLLTPGDADSALTVGNVDINKSPAGSSGHGPNASNRVKPEVCALGQPGSVITSTLTPYSSSGTSVATPQVAGWAACLWQGSPGKNNVQIKRAIIETGHLYPSPQMPQLGYGVPNFCNAQIRLDVETPEENNTLKASLYPNPFGNTLTLDIGAPGQESSQLTISIYDLTGREVFIHSGKWIGHKLQLTLPAQLSNGVYLCKVALNDQTRNFRLVKE